MRAAFLDKRRTLWVISLLKINFDFDVGPLWQNVLHGKSRCMMKVLGQQPLRTWVHFLCVDDLFFTWVHFLSERTPDTYNVLDVVCY